MPVARRPPSSAKAVPRPVLSRSASISTRVPASLQQLALRIRNYLENEWLTVLFELAVIWVVIYLILRFLRGTRGARVIKGCLLYTSPSPRDQRGSRMPSSA